MRGLQSMALNITNGYQRPVHYKIWFVGREKHHDVMDIPHRSHPLGGGESVSLRTIAEVLAARIVNINSHAFISYFGKGVITYSTAPSSPGDPNCRSW